jgi:hypothetical protein
MLQYRAGEKPSREGARSNLSIKPTKITEVQCKIGIAGILSLLGSFYLLIYIKKSPVMRSAPTKPLGVFAGGTDVHTVKWN